MMLLGAMLLGACTNQAVSERRGANDRRTMSTAPVVSTTSTTSTTVPPDQYANAGDAAAAASTRFKAGGEIAGLYGVEKPPGYGDGCHANHGALKPRIPCQYGRRDATRTMVLIGDSHAAHWFAGLEALALEDGWKLVSMTKTGCTSPDVSIQLHAAWYKECDTWRRNTIKAANALQPDLVVLPLLTRHGLWGRSRRAAPLLTWERAITTTVQQLRSSGASVLVLSDTPRSKENPRGCTIARRDTDLRPCMNRRSDAVLTDRIEAQRRGAKAGGGHFVDVSNWVCGPELCNVVIDNTAVYRDEGHLSNAFARLLVAQLRQAVTEASAERAMGGAKTPKQLDLRPDLP